MKVITDCSVTLLSAPLMLNHPEYLLPPDGTEAERIIAMGGKVCYDTYGADGNPVKAHVRNLVSQLHFSVIEHVNVGVIITGISRGLSHEIVRHRHFSFSQRSTRYTAEEDANIVLEPYLADIYNRREAWLHDSKLPAPTDRELDLIAEYMAAAVHAVGSYSSVVRKLLLDAESKGMTGKEMRKWARGKARQRLPHDLETRMVMTGNLRSWREFLVKRTSRHAEPEIRRLAERIYGILIVIAPNAFSGMVSDTHDGYIELSEPRG